MRQTDTENAGTVTDEKEGRKQPSIKIDEAIKHLFRSEKQALIRLVNGALGESYDPDATELVELNAEFVHRRLSADGPNPEAEHFDLERLIADMIFSLDGVAYHIEFQTTADRTIIIRVVGYGVEHALSGMRNRDVRDEVVFELPVPVLIQIDKDERLADRIPAVIRLSGREEAQVPHQARTYSASLGLLPPDCVESP